MEVGGSSLDSEDSHLYDKNLIYYLVTSSLFN